MRAEKFFLISHHPALRGASFSCLVWNDLPPSPQFPCISLNSVGAYKDYIIKRRYCLWRDCSEEKDAIVGRSRLAGWSEEVDETPPTKQHPSYLVCCCWTWLLFWAFLQRVLMTLGPKGGTSPLQFPSLEKLERSTDLMCWVGTARATSSSMQYIYSCAI